MSDRAATAAAAIDQLVTAGRIEEAGEALRSHGEALARSDPRRAVSWLRGLVRWRGGEPLLDGYVAWTAGAVLHLAGRIQDAAAELERATAAMRRCGRRDLADRVQLLTLDLLGERLELTQARRLAARLGRRFRARGDRVRWAVALSNLACAEDAADRVRRAGDLWRTARPLFEPGSLRRLLVDANLASVAAMAGRHADATAALHEVVRRARQTGREPVALQAELNLAEVEFADGLVDQALARWSDVIERSAAAGLRAVRAAALVDLAAAEIDLGDHLRGRRRLLEARRAADQSGLTSESRRATRLLAVLDVAAGDPTAWHDAAATLDADPVQRDLVTVEAAEAGGAVPSAALERAARRLIRAGLEHRGRVGLAWAARSHLRNGRPRPATRLAREVLASRRASAWARLVAHHVLGGAGGPRATRHLFEAVRWADRLHGRLAAAADRAAFLGLRGEVYLDLVGALLDRDRAADRRRALELLGRFRSGWLIDELASRADRGDDPLVQRWQQLRRRLSALLARVEGVDEARLRRSGLAIHASVTRVESELQDVELRLARRWPDLLPHARTTSPVAELLQRLPADNAFVEYFLDRDDLLVFVAAHGRLHARRQSGVAGEIRRLATSIRFHLDAHTWLATGKGRPARGLDRRLAQLAELLLGGLPIDDAQVLWIAPHGVLFQLPWPALPTTAGNRLVDHHAIGLVPGAGCLAALLAERPRAPHSLAVSGGPGDGLPLVAEELRELAGLWPQAETIVDATRAQFLATLTRYDAVHLAGHSVFLEGLPAASGLRLKDGFVTVHDLGATRIAARLVSFGVCSGVRVSTADDHRYEGFLRSLLAGGVRSVVGAVTPVRDEVARAFDVAFHRTLAGGGGPTEAYTRGLAAIREIDAHPATWGVFHLYGDVRAWENA